MTWIVFLNREVTGMLKFFFGKPWILLLIAAILSLVLALWAAKRGSKVWYAVVVFSFLLAVQVSRTVGVLP